MTQARLGLKVKVVGQRSKSNMFLHGCYLLFQGQGQRSGSRSKVGSNFWRAAVDNRGSALLSAAKSRVITSLRCLCVCNQWVYADNRANAVDQRFNISCCQNIIGDPRWWP